MSDHWSSELGAPVPCRTTSRAVAVIVHHVAQGSGSHGPALLGGANETLEISAKSRGKMAGVALWIR
jgi:hypothetical protein